MIKILSDSYYKGRLGGETPTQYAQELVKRAQGSALPSFRGVVGVEEVVSPAVFYRGVDSGHLNSKLGNWWVQKATVKRFALACREMDPGLRYDRLLQFVRARAAVSLDWSDMAALVVMKISEGARTPAILGKAGTQRFVTDEKDSRYVNNVFWIGGDTQYFIRLKEDSWITPVFRGMAAWA